MLNPTVILVEGIASLLRSISTFVKKRQVFHPIVSRRRVPLKHRISRTVSVSVLCFVLAQLLRHTFTPRRGPKPIIHSSGTVRALLVFNDVPWHSEVAYAAMRLQSMFATTQTIVYDQSQRVAGLMTQPGDKEAVRVKSLAHFYSLTMDIIVENPNSSHVVFFVTPELCRPGLAKFVEILKPYRKQFAFFWMCHNVDMCSRCLRITLPQLRHIVTVSPTARMEVLLRSKGYNVVRWIPFLPVSNIQQKRPVSKDVVRIAVPGSVNFSKRNYAALELIPKSPVHETTELVVFGKCLWRGYCMSLRVLQYRLGLKGVRLVHSNHFETGQFESYDDMFATITSSDFIFPAIDETVPLAENYQLYGKLTASVVLGLSAEVPMILWCELAQLYELHSQPCYKSIAAMPSAVERAFRLNPSKYGELVKEMHNVKAGIQRQSEVDFLRYLNNLKE